jgi:hypothetical protein
VFVRLREWLRAPTPRGTVLLTYVGIFGAIAFGVVSDNQAANDLTREARVRAAVLAEEAHVREEQICGVIVAVHNNAKFRLSTEQRRVESTVDYLTDPTVKRDALYRRIAENLPGVRADRDVAKNNVNATEPPAICDKYQG